MWVIAVTPASAAVSVCPVCDVPSIYTNGHSACSLRCALIIARSRYLEFGLPLERAIALVSHTAQAIGLPKEPRPGDKFRYRYVLVHEESTSTYWCIDRDLLLDAGLNVEYAWVGKENNARSRVYRFSPQALARLPKIMHDCKVQSLAANDVVYLYGPSTEQEDGSVVLSSPYWHFLSAPEKA